MELILILIYLFIFIETPSVGENIMGKTYKAWMINLFSI